MDPIRVLLADDHTLFRKGLRTILEQMPGIEVASEASTGSEVVAQARELVPDVVLMDIRMPVINGIEATRQILAENPHIGVILVTMLDDSESVFSGMRAGARGYVLKEADPEELRRAIEAAAQGHVLLPAEVARKVLQHFDRQSPVSQLGIPSGELSQRELQVLQLAATGLTNKEIAGNLVISEKTVKNHVANIFSKLQVNDRTQAILSAIRRGLISINREGIG